MHLKAVLTGRTFHCNHALLRSPQQGAPRKMVFIEYFPLGSKIALRFTELYDGKFIIVKPSVARILKVSEKKFDERDNFKTEDIKQIDMLTKLTE